MRTEIIISALLMGGMVLANPIVEIREWRPACDGSALEIVRDGGVVRSIRASANHFDVLVEWTVHFMDGKPVSVEYRESKRERFKDGTKAGELTGKIELTVLKTWKPENNHFKISDSKLMAELDQILNRTENKAEQCAAPLPAAPPGPSDGAR